LIERKKMRVQMVLLVLLGFFLWTPPVSTEAQSWFVKIRFEVDGKHVLSGKFKVLINADGQTIEPRLLDNGFVVPPEVSHSKKIELRFVSGEYDLLFSPLTKDHFDSEWIIGVNNPPFEKRSEVPLVKDGKELRLVYYIEFHPKSAEGTKWVTHVYK
jgi:hypothetical protein